MVAPVLHEYVEAPLAVKEIGAPLQTVDEGAVILTVGFATTETVLVVEEEQTPFVPVTV